MYIYEDYKSYPCSEEGQAQFLSIRDRVLNTVKRTGCISMNAATAGEVGLNFKHLACVDRLVELGEIREIENPYSRAGQHRIFVPGKYN